MVFRMLVYMRKRVSSQNDVCMTTRDRSQNAGLHENNRWFSKHWFAQKKWLSKCWVTREQEMALKTLVYTRKRDGCPVGLHENKRWL